MYHEGTFQKDHAAAYAGTSPSEYQTLCSTSQRIVFCTAIRPDQENLRYRTLVFSQNQLEQTVLNAHFGVAAALVDTCRG